MSFLHAFTEGGFFMYFILALGFFTVSFIVERTLALYGRRGRVSSQLREQLLAYLQHGDLDGALTYLRAVPPSALTRVAEGAFHLRARSGAEEELQSRMDEQLTAEIAKIDRRTGYLAMFGNVATLLGLLGTITGMIHSFGAVASASAADRAMLLSKGISEAMNCTAFGLVVAIPALVAYAVFQARIDRLVTELTEGATKIYHDLVFLYEPKRAEAR